QRGSTSAMIYLALLYEQGTIREPQPELSTQWLAKAANAGNPIAQYHYGMALINGVGITKQPQSGIQWIAEAAKQGEVLAIKHLAKTRCLNAHC
ncbi:MAG: sel1 repeat family protein, partial [Alteromonas sp.]|nr:sel1 repeat family protein [Alteromonas sp.]